MTDRWRVILDKRPRQERRARQAVTLARADADSAERDLRALRAEAETLAQRARSTRKSLSASGEIALERCLLIDRHCTWLGAKLDMNRTAQSHAEQRLTRRRTRLTQAARVWRQLIRRIEQLVAQRDRERRQQRARVELTREERRVEDWQLTKNSTRTP